MATQIQLRRGTEAEWTSANPVLANGEVAVSTDTNKIKIGNGSLNWTALPYLSVSLGTDTVGNYISTISASGSGISIAGSGSETASVTITNTGVVSIIGTENEIDVSASTGSVTLSLPSTINADTTGNAATATALETARTISLGGDLSGSASFDGTSNITITASVESQSSVNSLTGTENEIEVSASVGDITLSLPSTINANTTGTAASLTTARTIALSGDISGSVTFDGSASVDIVTEIQPNSVALGTDTTGDYVHNISASDGISASGTGESASVTLTNTDKGSSQNIFKTIVSDSGDVTAASNSASVTIAGGTAISTSISGNTLTITNDGVSDLTGTVNEVEVSASTGSITIGLPSTINANTTGTAAALTNSRTIALSGDVSGSVTFDGSASVDINTQIQPNSVALGTDTTGDYVASVSASGSGISVSGTGENASVTVMNTGVTSLAGTASQIAVSASNGDVTISLPSSVTFPGTVTLNANPSQALQAATKQYVDAVSEGLHIHASVQAATTASVDLNSPPATIDNVTLVNDMRVLVKNQSNAAENGIYVYNSASTTLTRSSDFDTISEIAGGDFVFVTSGNTYDNTGWVQTETVVTLGTDPILWQQFSGAGTYTAGIGLQLDGTVFSNTGVLSLQGTGSEINVSASSGNITLSLPETINADTTGNSATATKLANARIIELSGDISGSASFDGSASISINTTIEPNSVALGTDTTGNYVATISGTANEIEVSGSGSEGATVTIGLPETINANTTGTAAALTTARAITLSGDVSGTTNFDGSSSAGISTTLANTTVSPSSYGSASAVGTFTVDSKGRLTEASNVAIAIEQSAVANLTADLSAKAPLASPTFTGTVTVPTPSNSTDAATKAYVDSVIINTQTASYQLVLADAGEVIEMNVATANNLTVPLNSSVPFPIGTSIDIVQYGAGQTTIVATGGVTIRSSGNKLKLTGQYSAATLYKRGTDEWVAMGDLSA